VAQKIVSKAEGRRVALETVTPSDRAVELAATAGKDPRVVELVLRESRAVLRCRPGVLIVEDRRGFVLANAGIDASNVEADDGRESVLLLPVDPDASAASLRGRLRAATGMPGLLDLRGRPDRTGRLLATSELGLADEVAAAASLVMGQTDEGRPVVLLRGVPYQRREGSARELIRPEAMDLFR
jgi:coenzyme F420-0:L-glutamate ligase / coenzyme F420-1:gamma-L-glutamate ligase